MKYQIDYIEFWATRHCNLRCKGCSSCSPISKEWFLSIDNIRKDLTRLKELDIEIKNITILGGEPLLHPNISEIMNTVKTVYPNTNLGIITNGLLLLSMDELFWETCCKCKLKINITCFPIMKNEMKENIEKVINGYQLDYRMTNKKRFNKILTQDHNQDINEVVRSCGCNNAYNLKDGFVSRCTVPMAAPILNSVFDAHMIESGILDIYKVNDGKEILDFLHSPNDSCKNCTSRPIKVEWEMSDSVPKLSDWIV